MILLSFSHEPCTLWLEVLWMRGSFHQDHWPSQWPGVLLALLSFWFQHRHRLLGEFLLTSLNRISCPLSMLPVPQLTFLSVLNTQRILLCPLDPSPLYTTPNWEQRCIYCSPLSAERRSRPRFPWGCPQLSLYLESFQTQILWGGPCLQKLTTTS